MSNLPEPFAPVSKVFPGNVDINSFKTINKEIKEDEKDFKSLKKDLMVKICGITRESDLKCAESQGSDYIGFINVKRSPRFQKIDQIKALIRLLSDKNKAVLVLEPENTSEALNKIIKSGIFNIQLHSLDLNDLKDLKSKIYAFNIEKDANSRDQGLSPKGSSPKINIIRAIGLSDKLDDSKKLEIKSFSEICDGLLFDYQIQGKSGGTGKQIPLDLATKAAIIARSTNNNIKIFLAGGMDIEMIKTEGKIINQYFDVVDFNSSLEDAPGIKNKTKIKNLMVLIKDNWRCDG